MKRYAKLTVAVALATVSLTANAWWGGLGDLYDDFFGGVNFNFSLHMSGGGSGWNRYSAYDGPWGYGPYPGIPYGVYLPIAPPVAPTVAPDARRQNVLDRVNTPPSTEASVHRNI